MKDNFKFLEIAKQAAFDSGEILNAYFRENPEVTKKGPVDIVTAADIESEKKIIEIISKNFPDHFILSEESGKIEGSSEFEWIIDPLDGTTNFANKLPIFSVSIALYKNQKPLIGVVFNPYTEELYWAVNGNGAFLGEKKISVSNKKNINDSLIVTGFPYNFMEILDELSQRFFNVLKISRGVRRLGSAALDLCFVASGVFEGFFEQNLKPWDTAAGIIIAHEAGAIVTDFKNNRFNPYMNEIITSNGYIHNSLLNAMEIK
ncbi:MAG: inositol monophosphatase [Desulfobacteraceae bacterium]|nr:inositol monophosphatase [Desulfobacteraceae bacterium]